MKDSKQQNPTSPAVSAPTPGAPRKLVMQYAGGVVKHLGLAMYRGAVPSIAELIANSWDADATRVEVTIPFGVSLDDQEIRVKDNGRGMTWEECLLHYLVVGRDRREQEGDHTKSGRPVMGRKGLGKLAGFGIATLVEVRTVRDKWLTHFSMDFGEMTRGGKAALVENYEPNIIRDDAVEEPNGTEIILKHLILKRSIPEESFRRSMARRFAVLGSQFQVLINDVPLEKEEVSFQFRFPEHGVTSEDVPGLGAVTWWAGFTEKPIQVEDARGIAIIVRGKMAQTPFFFDLSGGAYGQHGMQYLTGEVTANQLDAEQDFVATDRQSIVWTEPGPESLLRWGQDKVRNLLREWANLRTESNEEKLKKTVNDLDETIETRISRLPESEQKEARQVVYKLATIASITDEPDRARELLDLVLRAFEDSSFFALLRALNATDKTERDEVLKLVTELDVFETVKMAEVVRARVGVIQKFREMIDTDVPEKPDLQDFLYDHTWLIDPEWNVVEHEARLDTLLIKHFDLDPEADVNSDRRVDFFCIGTRGRYLVVEVKRPSQPISEKQVVQIMRYVNHLRQQAPSTGNAPNYYEGVLVGHHLTPDGRAWAESARKDGVTVRTWSELLDVAERIHRDFLAVVKKRAPEDPRVRNLPGIDEAPKTKQAETGPPTESV
jgi:hypothetical protein